MADQLAHDLKVVSSIPTMGVRRSRMFTATLCLIFLRYFWTNKYVLLVGLEPPTPGLVVQGDTHYTTVADEILLFAILYIVNCFISQKWVIK